MKNRKKPIAVLLMMTMFMAVLTISMISTPIKASSMSNRSFQNYNQDEMVKAMGAGWNLGNSFESAINGNVNETYFGNPVVTEEMILAVKKAGFNSVRIPVSYLNAIGSAPNYTIDSTWLDRIQEVVDMCVKNDMYAIINIHGDGYNTVSGGWLLCNGSNQATIKAKYQACWKQIATRFSNYDQHLIFESMNEEFDNTYGTPNKIYYENINAYNQIFVDTVRQTGGNNDKRWLLIPGWNTNIEYTAGNYGFKLPTDDYLSSECDGKRIMISVHYYDPWDFCGTESSAVTKWDDEAYMESKFKQLYNAFVKKGYPVVIGEYGAIDKSQDDYANTSYREAYYKAVCKYSSQYGCVPVAWDNGYNGKYGFGLFNRKTYEVTQQGIIDSIMTYYGQEETEVETPDSSVSSGNVEATFEMTSDWGQGGIGQITIKNTSGTSFTEGWTLEFDLDCDITSCWSGNLVKSTNGHHIIKNPSWNGYLAAGETITLTFQLTKENNTPVLSNVTIY